ncbi:MAG TPA: Hpt domain-containing protein [Gammaproteobacteria bacterium]|nr:Hpt domain-containing protein [Gammaproteobacteria bacterium]
MNEPVLDSLVFNEISDLMDDALGEFIGTYLDNSPRLLEKLDTALSQGDLQGVFHNAHQLKGGSGSIGAMQVFYLAKEIETQARGGSAEQLEKQVSELQLAFERVAVELRAHQ